MSDDAISPIRMKAELARRLATETKDPAARAGLLELGSLLDADADKLEMALRRTAPRESRGD